MTLLIRSTFHPTNPWQGRFSDSPSIGLQPAGGNALGILVNKESIYNTEVDTNYERNLNTY